MKSFYTLTWKPTKLGREKIIFQYFSVLHFVTQQIPYWPDEKKLKKKHVVEFGS